MATTPSHGKQETPSIFDPTQIGLSEYAGVNHNNDLFRSLSSHLPKFKKAEKNFTEDFFKSLHVPVPTKHKIELFNFHIYGGPSTGKSELARAVGHHLKNYYGDMCQCIECQFLPDSIHHIDPTRSVIVISVDDPMGAAEEGGTQDARRGMSEDVDIARATFNAIRHIYRKRVLLHRAEQFCGKSIPDRIQQAIDLYHDNYERLCEYLPREIATVGAVLFVMWGPQMPTIDQTFHQNKMWNIYKGFSSMDEKRKRELHSHLGSFWMQKLGGKEKAWRRGGDESAKSWSVIEDPYTNEKGWLYITPKQNIFQKVDRGGKGFQEKIRVDTERMDTWAKYIYQNKNSLMPPYDPFGKKENRTRSLSNFITDVLKSDKDPRTFEKLSPHVQIFLKRTLKGKITPLDDRIIKYHFSNMDERAQIESIAQQLVVLLEEESISPHMKSGRAITHDLARRRISGYRQLIDKPGNFKKIFDHLLYLWFQLHPEESKRGKAEEKTKPKVADIKDEKLIRQATVEINNNCIEFIISEQELIESILNENEGWHDGALIYQHTEGIGNRDVLTNRQMYLISQNEDQRKEYGFTEAFKSIEAVKYRKKQFRGIMSYKLGKLFEDWLEKMLVDGYHIMGMLDDIQTVQHGNYEQKGNPDFVLKHNDGSFTVLAAKCYASTRSETLEREEISPEIRYHNTLLERGEKSRIAVIYTNIQIPHMLIVYIYENASDVPANLTFSPSMQNHYHFIK